MTPATPNAEAPESHLISPGGSNLTEELDEIADIAATKVCENLLHHNRLGSASYQDCIANLHRMSHGEPQAANPQEAEAEASSEAVTAAARAKEMATHALSYRSWAPAPAGMAAPGPSPMPGDGNNMHMDEGIPLPTQGFQGPFVAHDNYKTMISDWGAEFGPKMLGKNKISEICKDYPNAKWCRYYKQSHHADEPVTGSEKAFLPGPYPEDQYKGPPEDHHAPAPPPPVAPTHAEKPAHSEKPAHAPTHDSHDDEEEEEDWDGDPPPKGYEKKKAGHGHGDKKHGGGHGKSDEACEDYEDWESSSGVTCKQYEEVEFCKDGGYGKGWKKEYGTFRDWADVTGVSADEACCACGGGKKAGSGASRGQPVSALFLLLVTLIGEALRVVTA